MIQLSVPSFRFFSRSLLYLALLCTPALVFSQDCDEGPDDECYGGCDEPPDDGDPFDIPRVHAVDPNEITGELGFDSAQWVSAFARLGYTVYFENDPDFATAPAQVVTIRLPVHENLNMFTVHLGSFGFGIYNFDVPPATTYYQQRLDVRDSLNCYVDITAGIDVVKNELFWIFESIDPLTGLPPQDAQTGFLPVNDTTVNIYNDSTIQKGEGYVNFTIMPKPTVQTGDTITAKASIIFDINAPIETNTWTNLLDAVAPMSQIDTAVDLNNGSFQLEFFGSDDPGGVGIAFYDLYGSKDGGPFVLLKEKIDTTVATISGSQGSSYAYYTLATDNVGNQELPKFEGEVTVEYGITGWTGGPVVYVNHAAMGLNNGTTWIDAFLDLQDALTVMNQFDEVEEIWIAEGNYYPTGTLDRTIAFTFMDDTKLYGGFEGNESERTERDPAIHPVVLSGDIGEQSSFPDNSIHVVLIDSTCTDCLLDGVQVAFGYATESDPVDQAGAGVLSYGTALLNNVQIQFCFALNTGAAVFNTGPSAHLELSGCLVTFNISILDDKDMINLQGASMEFSGINTIRQ